MLLDLDVRCMCAICDDLLDALALAVTPAPATPELPAACCSRIVWLCTNVRVQPLHYLHTRWQSAIVAPVELAL
jgi:hypothetical protein